MYTILGKPTKMDHSRPLWPLFLPFLHIWWFTKIFLPMVGLEPWNSGAGVDGNQCSSSLIGVSDHICFQKSEKKIESFSSFFAERKKPRKCWTPVRFEYLSTKTNIWPKNWFLVLLAGKKSWKKNFDAKWNNWFYDRIIYFPFISCSEILNNCCTKKSKLNLN